MRQNKTEEMTFEEPCYYCGSRGVDPAVLQGWCVPICDTCLEAEAQSPALQNPGPSAIASNQYWYAKRSGRWYLEMYVYSTGLDGPLVCLDDINDIDLAKAPTEEDIVRLSGLHRLPGDTGSLIIAHHITPRDDAWHHPPSESLVGNWCGS